ncbi:MAG: hypothetical protein WCK32_05535 [Chlorobiaceae bacterium]
MCELLGERMYNIHYVMRATLTVALCTVAKYLIGHDNKITTVEREGAAFASKRNEVECKL